MKRITITLSEENYRAVCQDAYDPVIENGTVVRPKGCSRVINEILSSYFHTIYKK